MCEGATRHLGIRIDRPADDVYAFAFAPPNEFGVLDHDVTLSDGQTVRNPIRVSRDLQTLKRVAEGG